MKKRAAALGSALPDPVRSADTASPVPSPIVANKTAPGRRGPMGLSPRTTYSRVNSGPPPVSDVGAGAQKSVPPRGAEFLPAKTAQSEDFKMIMAQHPTLQEMLKAAMEGTAGKVDVTLQAAQQQSIQTGEEPEKVASDESSDHLSTEQLSKLAGALDFIATGFLKEADQGNIQMPGKGPQALPVLESNRTDENIDAGEGGHATAKHLPPKDPSLQKEEVQAGKANTGLQTNDDMNAPEQPKDPWANERASLQNAVTKQGSVSDEPPVERVLAVLEKTAKEKKPLGEHERHYVRRVLLGTPISSAVEAKKGKKLRAFGESMGHWAKNYAGGAAGGGAIGAGLGALSALKSKNPRAALKRSALSGAGTGAYLGSMGGSIKGQFGRKASEIHGKYSKTKGKTKESASEEKRPLGEHEKHYVRRTLLGNPISAAIEAKKGKKMEAFGEAYGHGLQETLKGLGKGTAAGVPTGALIGALASKGRRLRGAGVGAAIGGGVGAYGGAIGGGMKGHLGRKASEIHGKYSKTKEGQQGTLAERMGAGYGKQMPNIMTGVGGLYGAGGGALAGKALGGGGKGALLGAGLGALAGGTLGRGAGYFQRGMMRGTPEHQAAKVGSVDVSFIRKLAEDAVYPAKIQGGPQVPPAAVPAGTGMPPVPSDVRSQQKLVGSNDAAINYTKGQAKADPKSDLGKVLTEPALTSKTDKTLQKTLAHTGEAGVKISSMQKMASDATRVAAARALISNLQKQAAASCPDNKNKKEKSSMMGAAPTTPSSATGMTAATMG